MRQVIKCKYFRNGKTYFCRYPDFHTKLKTFKKSVEGAELIEIFIVTLEGSKSTVVYFCCPLLESTPFLNDLQGFSDQQFE